MNTTCVDKCIICIVSVRVGTEVESTNHSTNVYITPDSDEGKCNRRDFIAGNEVSDEFKKLEAPKAHSDKAFSQSKQEFLTKPLSPPTDSKPKTLVNVPKEKARDDQEPALAKVFSSVVLPDQGGGQVQMDKRKTLPLPKPSKHPLEFEWSFWYSDVGVIFVQRLSIFFIVFFFLLTFYNRFIFIV